jgi:hypothetical protein
MLVLSIHKHGRSFHFLMSSSISFFSGLLFLLNRSLISFVKFIPRYCIFFEAMVNEVFSLSVQFWYMEKLHDIFVSCYFAKILYDFY